jgi:hypothetical protein
MNNKTETMPFVEFESAANRWRPRLFRATYILACALAVFGWTVALSWVAISLLKLFVNQFT